MIDLKLIQVRTYVREELTDRIWERVGYRNAPYLKVMRELIKWPFVLADMHTSHLIIIYNG